MTFLKEAEARGLPRVQTVQNAYHLMNRTYETAMAEVSLREGVGLLAYSPLAQGFLTGKYLDGARPAGARVTLFDRQQRYQKPGSEEAVRDYVQIAREAGLDPATLAIAFVVSRHGAAEDGDRCRRGAALSGGAGGHRPRPPAARQPRALRRAARSFQRKRLEFRDGRAKNFRDEIRRGPGSYPRVDPNIKQVWRARNVGGARGAP